MLRIPIALSLALLLVPAISAHPPAADPQNACLGLPAVPGPKSPVTFPVVGTLSYVAFPGTSLPPCVPTPGEWGSHAPPCPLAPGPIPGAYCGPLVPPLLTATCTWFPVANKVPTGLVIGFDEAPYNGLIQLAAGEGPVTIPLPPGAWTVTNPGPLPARVIAYPTNTVFFPGPPPAGVLAPGDVNNVICIVP